MAGPITNDSTELSQAIKSGDAAAIETIISNASEAKRSSLLIQGLTIACEQRQLAGVHQFLALGADPSTRHGERLPPLMLAAQQAPLLTTAQQVPSNIAAHQICLDIVEALLQAAPNYHDALVKKKTIRSALARTKSPAVARLLIENGAEIESMDKEGNEPLIESHCLPPIQLAAKFDLLETVRLLLDRDAEDDGPRLSSDRLRTALHFAQSREVAQQLILHGADIISSKDGRTILMDKIRHYPVAQLLIDHDVPLNETDKDGKTALMIILEEDGDLEIANYIMIRGGLDVMKAADFEGRTVLMYALWKNRVDIVKKLVAQRVDVLQPDRKQRNILHHMAQDERRKYKYRPEPRTGENREQQDHDEVLLDEMFPLPKRIHLGEKDYKRIDLKGTDYQRRTPVHWAAANGCAGLLRLLLGRGIFDLEMVERKNRTALHLAAENGHVEVVELLLSENANVNAESDSDWTPLHSACANTADQTRIVELLLSHGSSLNKPNKAGRTPLHTAAAAGNLSIVKFLLKQKGIDRNATDAFGNTPLLCAAKVASDDRTTMLNLFAPWRKDNIEMLSKESRQAMQLFPATIVDFGDNYDKATFGWAGHLVHPETTVFDLLHGREEPEESGPSPSTTCGHASEDNAPPAIPVLSRTAGDNAFRWIHLPANNMAWCQELITKYFVEQSVADVDSLKALERSFNHQHVGRDPQARYMTPVCQNVLRSWGSAEGGYAKDGGRRGTNSRQSTMEPLFDTDAPRTQSPQPAASNHLPADRSPSEFTAPVTNRDTLQVPPQQPNVDGVVAERAKRKQIRAAEKQKRAAKKQRKREQKIMDEKGPEVRVKAIEAGGRKPPYIQPRPSDGTVDGSISDFYVFMPYVHFETLPEMIEMTQMTSIYHESGGSSSSNSKHPVVASQADLRFPTAEQNSRRKEAKEALIREQALFRAYLGNPGRPLHIRRTLDQSFYHHIDTKSRDRDQVIHKFQTQHEGRGDPAIKLLMVDQLWMWVIGSKLIITSFPQRWKQPRKDPLNVLDSILAILNTGSRERVRKIQELALIVLGRCYGAYDRNGVESDDLQYLDMFEGWIGIIMDKEVKMFQSFSEDSEKTSAWLKNPTSVQGFIQTLLDVEPETRLLKEIKDIQDELAMLSLIFEQQKSVLDGVRATMDALVKQNLSEPRPSESSKKRTAAVQRKLQKALDDQEKTILHPQRDIERMEKQAKRIYASIRDLLDLKQKHANAIEARYAGHRTDDTSRQGRTLMVFTIVTVVFLPLSFMTAFFAIDIDGLPHSKDTQVLPLGFVLKYTLGIGLSFAIIFILIALYPYYSTYFASLDKPVESAKVRVHTVPDQPLVPEKTVSGSSGYSTSSRRSVSANRVNRMERGEGREAGTRQQSITKR